MSDALEPEDAKLLLLARSARLRAYAPHTGRTAGAAVRDTDGRTYAAGTVENAQPALTTSALRAAVAAAVSSGIRTFECAVVLGDPGSLVEDLSVLAEFGAGIPLLVADAEGLVVERLAT